MIAPQVDPATMTTYRVTVANGTHEIAAPSALVACEQAQERWGTWPTSIDKVRS